MVLGKGVHSKSGPCEKIPPYTGMATVRRVFGMVWCGGMLWGAIWYSGRVRWYGFRVYHTRVELLGTDIAQLAWRGIDSIGFV